MPMAGMTGSDLMRYFQTVTDPYTGAVWAAIPAIAPDWAILHVQEADEAGNIRINGAAYDDLLKAKAAAHVMVTCERLIPMEKSISTLDRTALPGFLVDAVILSPIGAWPHSCEGEYDFDEAFFREYLAAAASDKAYQSFLKAKGIMR